MMSKTGNILKILGAFGGGTALGFGLNHVITKSNLDNLQSQVETLQEENKRLIAFLEDAEAQVEKLILKCKIAAFESVLSDKENKKLRIILKYAIMEYADIYVKRINECDIYENDRVFFKIMDDFIEGKSISDDMFKRIIYRISLRYKTQIEGDVEPDYDAIINQLGMKSDQKTDSKTTSNTLDSSDIFISRANEKTRLGRVHKKGTASSISRNASKSNLTVGEVTKSKNVRLGQVHKKKPASS